MIKFIVLYSDKTHFSGDPLKRDWDNIDESKKIVRFVYQFDNRCLVLEGFKQYNHCKERLGLQGKGIGKILIMGRREKDTLVITFDLVKNKIFQKMVSHEKEYGKQIIAGWKEGILKEPKAYFKDLKNV